MKTRIISAIFLILIAIPIIIAGDKTFALAIGVVGVFGLKEILDLKKSHGTVPPLMTLVFYITLLAIIYISPFDFSQLMSVNYQIIGFLLLIFLLPTLFYSPKKVYSTNDAFYFLAFILFLGIACHNIIMIRVRSLWLFIYVLLIPILTDSFAFHFGTLIGKHHIAPNISPKKTWEGSIMGSILATIVSSVFYYFAIGTNSIVCLILFTLILSITAQLGDLFFSKIKRENEVKDFSNLIPGHGGILDRFDSIIMVSIMFSILGFYL